MVMTKSLWAALFACFFACVNAAPGTTPNFPDIFMGRCLDIVYGFSSPIKDYKPNINCTNIFLAFQSAFIGRDPLSVNEDSFANYFAAADQTVDRLLFWTGSDRLSHDPLQNGTLSFYDLDLVHVISDSGHHFWTLEDTLWGYLVNSLTFCGANLDQQATGAVFNYTFCPPYGTNGSSISFWNAASKFFAQHASHEVTMVARATMRNGQPSYVYRSPALGNYNPAVGIFASIFATYELPNIPVNLVTSFTIWLVPSPDLPGEDCGQPTSTTNNLMDDLVARGIPRSVIKCINNPPAVEFSRCADSLTSVSGGLNDPGLACQFDPNNPYVINRSDLGPPGSVAALVIMLCLVVAALVFLVTFYFAAGRCPWQRKSFATDSSSTFDEHPGRKTKNSVI